MTEAIPIRDGPPIRKLAAVLLMHGHLLFAQGAPASQDAQHLPRCTGVPSCLRVLQRDPNDIAALEQLGLAYNRQISLRRRGLLLFPPHSSIHGVQSFNMSSEASMRSFSSRNRLSKPMNNPSNSIQLRPQRSSIWASPIRNYIAMTMRSKPIGKRLRSSPIGAKPTWVASSAA
jgi:hypothetical protein